MAMTEKRAMSLGKPGRPRIDAARERLRIYAAATPVIGRYGSRAPISALAASAHLSVGGLYHYFPSKRSLLLHGLDPDALALACSGFSSSLAEAAARGPEALVAAYVDKSVYMLHLIRPSLNAAAELGATHLQEALSTTVRLDADHLIDSLITVAPDLDTETRTHLAEAYRRSLLALALDREASDDDVRRQLGALLFGFVSGTEPTATAVPPRRSGTTPSASSTPSRPEVAQAPTR